MAVLFSLQATVSVHQTSFTSCRAAIYMGGDMRSSDLDDEEVSMYQRLRYLDFGSTATSALRLESVSFASSGSWDVEQRFFGGGPVSVYDTARIFSDVDLQVPASPAQPGEHIPA